MNAASHGELLRELKRRVVDEAGLGLPQPRVSTEIANLLVDLLAALADALQDLELAELR